jgi:hypothetical protein
MLPARGRKHRDPRALLVRRKNKVDMAKSLSELTRSELGITVPDAAVALLQSGVWPGGASTTTDASGNVTVQGNITSTANLISGGTAGVVAQSVGYIGFVNGARLRSPATGVLNINTNSESIGSQLKVDALPTVTAGGGTTPFITAGSTPFAGSVNVGSGSPGATITVTFGGTAFPSAPFVVCMNVTTGLAVKAASTTTTLVITPQTGNFGVSDVITWICVGAKA